MVKELLVPTAKGGSPPGYAVFCFFCTVFFFSVWFKTIFPLGFFFFILTADLAGHALGSILIF